MDTLLFASQAVESGTWKEDVQESFSSLKHVKPLPQELAAVKHKRGMLSLLSWYARLNDFIDFRRQHGHGNVPQKHDPNPRLGFWVNNQRGDMKAYSEGKPSQMTSWKAKRLQEAGFVWAKPRGQSCWQRRFEELERFKMLNGHCNVPTKYKQNSALGRWVTAQRRYYDAYHKGQKVCVDTQEMQLRIEKLEALGFVWRKIASPMTDAAPTSSATPSVNTSTTTILCGAAPKQHKHNLFRHSVLSKTNERQSKVTSTPPVSISPSPSPDTVTY